jgi:hypothetical protein
MSVGLLAVRLLYRFYVFGHLSKSFTFLFISVVLLLSCRFLRLLVTVCGLAKAGIFTTKLPTKPKVQIYEKLSYEALNPRLRQTAVSGWHSCQFSCFVFFHFRILSFAFLNGEEVFNCIIFPKVHLSYQANS